MITLYGFPESRSIRVAWALEELELPWQFHYVDFYKGEHKAPAYLKINACGKVPALKDNELIVTESGAICQYLAEKYQDIKLIPKAGTAESAQHLQWMSFILCELEQPLWTMAKHKFALPEQYRFRDILATAQWEFEQACNVAQLWLGDKPYVLGQKFSVADIFLTQTLNWSAKFKQPLPDSLDQYRIRLSQRPALLRALDKEVAPQ